MASEFEEVASCFVKRLGDAGGEAGVVWGCVSLGASTDDPGAKDGCTGHEVSGDRGRSSGVFCAVVKSRARGVGVDVARGEFG